MLVRIGNFMFHWRNLLFPFACALVLLPGEDLFDDPLHAALVGFVVALVGQTVRILTIGFEYVVRGGRNRRVYADDLVTGGIYQLSRNPMYVGNLIILVGLALASNTWTCILVASVGFLFVYVAIVAAEESFLSRKFGAAYDRYRAEVPRWLPRAGAVRGAGVAGRFHWRRVLVKEYGTPMGWCTMLLAILTVQLGRAGLLDERQEELTVIVLAFAALFAAYLRVRALKLSRRLIAD